jgi:hypothetical protein
MGYYNITVHSLGCNKLNVSKMHGATIKIIPEELNNKQLLDKDNV